MNYGIKSLLKGIQVLQAEQLVKRAELLAKTQGFLRTAVNAGQLARLQVISALTGELTRLKEGYGDYGDFGVTKGYYSSLAQSGTLPKGTPWSPKDVKQLQQDVANLSGELGEDQRVHAELKALLEYADRTGQDTVTTSWLNRSGFKPADINRILLAAEREVKPRAE